MGESEFDVSGLPNLSRPEVDWVYANPAQELASLATRSADAQQNFAAGRLTKPELALIVIAFVVLIVVIIVH